MRVVKAYVKSVQRVYLISVDSLDSSFEDWMVLLKNRKQEASSTDYDIILNSEGNEKEQFLLSDSVPLLSELDRTNVVITMFAHLQREYTYHSILFHASYSYQIISLSELKCDLSQNSDCQRRFARVGGKRHSGLPGLMQLRF